MAIGVLNTQPLTFAQANPFLEGLKSGDTLANDTLEQQLNMLKMKNQAIQNQYLPQTLQEQLKNALLKNQGQETENKFLAPMDQAKLALLGAQTKKAQTLQWQSPFGKSLQDYNNIVKAYGPDSQQAQLAKMNLQRQAQGSQGLALSMNPDGTMNFSMGGQNADISRNPMFGTNKSAAGGTFQVTQDGQAKTISSPTTTSTTSNQAAISGAQRVTPILEDLMKTMPQFQSAWTKHLSDLQGFANKYLGGNYDLPSQRAQGLADISTSSEGLIKAYGLRVSEKALSMMEDAIKPRDGESPDGYKKRIVNTLQRISEMQGQAEGYQREGYDVSPRKSNVQDNDPLGIR